jgi:hypothetical protein
VARWGHNGRKTGGPKMAHWNGYEININQPYASIYAKYSRKLWQRLPIALQHPSGPRCVYPLWQRSWARATWKPLWWNWQLHPCGTCGIPNDLAILQALWVGGSPEWAYLRFLNVLNPVNGLIFYKAIKKTKILGYSTIPVSTWAYFLKGLKHKKNPKTNPKKI